MANFEERRDAARARAGGRNTSMTPSVLSRAAHRDVTDGTMPIDPDVPNQIGGEDIELPAGPHLPGGDPMAAVQVKGTPYTAAAGAVWNQIADLQKAIEDLTGRLQPILGPESPKLTADTSAKANSEKSSPIVEELSSMRNDLQRACWSVHALMRRLEL